MRSNAEWKQWNEFADGERSYECISKKLQLVRSRLLLLSPIASVPDESVSSAAYRVRELQQRLSCTERSLASPAALLCRLRLFVAVLASTFDERLALDTPLLGFFGFLCSLHKSPAAGPNRSLARLSASAVEPLLRCAREHLSRRLAHYLHSECLVRSVLSNVAHLFGRVLFEANLRDNQQHLLPLPFARLLRETLVSFLELKSPVNLECRVGLFVRIIQSLTHSAHLELQFGAPPVQAQNLVGALRALDRVCAQFCTFANEQNLQARAPLVSVGQCLVVSEQLCLLEAAVLQRVEVETVPALRDDELHEQLCRYVSELHSWHVQLALGLLCVRQLESRANVALRESVTRSLLARVLLAHECLVRFARGGCERDECCALSMFFRVLFEAYRQCFPKVCRAHWTSGERCAAAGHLCANEALRWAFEYAIEDTLHCMLGAKLCEDLVWFGEPFWIGSRVADGDLVVRRSRELAHIPFHLTEHKVSDTTVRTLHSLYSYILVIHLHTNEYFVFFMFSIIYFFHLFISF